MFVDCICRPQQAPCTPAQSPYTLPATSSRCSTPSPPPTATASTAAISLPSTRLLPPGVAACCRHRCCCCCCLRTRSKIAFAARDERISLAAHLAPPAPLPLLQSSHNSTIACRAQNARVYFSAAFCHHFPIALSLCVCVCGFSSCFSFFLFSIFCFSWHRKMQFSWHFCPKTCCQCVCVCVSVFACRLFELQYARGQQVILCGQVTCFTSPSPPSTLSSPLSAPHFRLAACCTYFRFCTFLAFSLPWSLLAFSLPPFFFFCCTLRFSHLFGAVTFSLSPFSRLPSASVLLSLLPQEMTSICC